MEIPAWMTKEEAEAYRIGFQKGDVMAEKSGKAIAERTAEAELANRLGRRFGLAGETVKGVFSKVLDISKKGNEKATATELIGFMIVCDQHNLNPFTRQIYAFVGKNGVIQPLVGIDGWIAIVNRQKMYDGCTFKFTDGENERPADCTCIMYLKNRSQPITITERYSECYRNTDPWRDMPYRMLRHKAYIQCARVAFGLSGIYDEDEVRDIVGEGEIVNMTHVEVIGSKSLKETPTQANGADLLKQAEAEMHEEPGAPNQPEEEPRYEETAEEKAGVDKALNRKPKPDPSAKTIITKQRLINTLKLHQQNAPEKWKEALGIYLKRQPTAEESVKKVEDLTQRSLQALKIILEAMPESAPEEPIEGPGKETQQELGASAAQNEPEAPEPTVEPDPAPPKQESERQKHVAKILTAKCGVKATMRAIREVLSPTKLSEKNLMALAQDPNNITDDNHLKAVATVVVLLPAEE